MKAQRQGKILEIVRERRIETQEELATALRIEGYDVTQATVSRDIKELSLIKIPGENHSSYYATPDESVLRRGDDRLRRLVRLSLSDINSSENLIIIKTPPGEAQGMASAIDHTHWQEIIGTVAGDDTILIVIKPKEATPSVVQRFLDLARG
ncbi:arginine repressor [Desulforamulus aquiferis]|uniref:Arginine repressor n=1 Tax=Desulforamulus aquiferis TaxID=1397668 RepID=A0AAW7ZAH8_9FIRM|nr:arginine repressor [Desulforamulus aquiferis]MDO7786406.1 arginine repressor [Desulforamulus aquiferis]RYD04439.1 arginine repressor ArgR [Desulforamulus aquiferis]